MNNICSIIHNYFISFNIQVAPENAEPVAPREDVTEDLPTLSVDLEVMENLPASSVCAVIEDLAASLDVTSGESAVPTSHINGNENLITEEVRNN